MGYEGFAEQTASLLLSRSNFDDYAEYAACKILEDDTIHTGCVSADFLAAGEHLITIYRMFRLHGRDIDIEFEGKSASERLRLLISAVSEWTDIAEFGRWLGKLLEFDAFILNEDRHMNNIAVVKKLDGTYKPMPVFDNGAAFLSDTARDYSLDSGMGLSRLISRVRSKPIVTDFDKQLAAVDEVVGLSLKFSCSPDAITVQSEEYPEQVLTRVKSIITHQASRYPYLFSSAPKSISPDPLARD